MIKQLEQEKRVLKLWNKAFDELSFVDKFRYYIRGKTDHDPGQLRDSSGEWTSKANTLNAIDPEAKPMKPVLEKIPIPRLQKKSYEQIGKAIVHGCHATGTKPQDKNHILNMLVGNVLGTTIQTATCTSKRKVRAIKAHGIKKTGEVTKKSDKLRRVVKISDGELTEALDTLSVDSCRFLAGKRGLKTVAPPIKISTHPSHGTKIQMKCQTFKTKSIISHSINLV